MSFEQDQSIRPVLHPVLASAASTILASSAARVGANSFFPTFTTQRAVLVMLDVTAFTSFAAFRWIIVTGAGNAVLFEDTASVGGVGKFAWVFGQGIDTTATTPGGIIQGGAGIPISSCELEVNADMTYSVHLLASH